jgi:hypothetical protein
VITLYRCRLASLPMQRGSGWGSFLGRARYFMSGSAAAYMGHQTHSSESIRPLWLRSIRAQAAADQYSSADR